MLDGMTNIKASEVLKELKDYTEDLPHYSPDEVAEALEMANKAIEQTRWIPVSERPMTEEEMKEYECDYGFIYTCPLPDDRQTTLIQTPWGIKFTEFYNDSKYGCYWEYYEDEGDVIAWMPLPEPYKAESEDAE